MKKCVSNYYDVFTKEYYVLSRLQFYFLPVFISTTSSSVANKSTQQYLTFSIFVILHIALALLALPTIAGRLNSPTSAP